MLGSSCSLKRGRRYLYWGCSISRCLILSLAFFFLSYSIQLPKSQAQVPASPRPPVSPSPRPEYLWYEAENMRGFATKPTGEPIQNPSWMNLSRPKAPGWGINGPGVSAEWSQGVDIEWNSAAASADETKASIYQDLVVPRAVDYRP